MISTETVTIDGRVFTHTYSDTYKIRKIGTDEIYTDAMDVLDYQYEETDMPLEAAPVDDVEMLRSQLAAKDAELSQLKAKMVRG
jgi:hypothetical protein